MRFHALLILFAVVGVPTVAHAQSAEQGLAYARANCARCHAIDKVSESPLRTAPPFRSLHQRYRVDFLAEALAEGITTGHPAMPEFTLTPKQIGDFLSFLETLK